MDKQTLPRRTWWKRLLKNTWSKLWESPFSKKPGLDLVIAVISAILISFIVDKDQHKDSELLLTVVVWVAAVSSFGISGVLDVLVFDPLFGTPKAQGPGGYKWVIGVMFPPAGVMYLFFKYCPRFNKLECNRREAVRVLKFPDLSDLPEEEDLSGIYGTAARIFGGSEEWEDKVKPWLEYSKAARVFILPIIVVVIWELVHYFTGWPPYIPITVESTPRKYVADLFLHWWVVYGTLQALVFLYLYLRVVHMINLYSLVTKSRISRFGVYVRAAPLYLRREMLSVGSVVVPVCELKIFQKRILSVGIDDATRKALEEIELASGQCLVVVPSKDVTEMLERTEEDDLETFVVSAASLNAHEEDLPERLSGKHLIVYPTTEVPDAGTLAERVKTALN